MFLEKYHLIVRQKLLIVYYKKDNGMSSLLYKEKSIPIIALGWPIIIVDGFLTSES